MQDRHVNRQNYDKCKNNGLLKSGWCKEKIINFFSNLSRFQVRWHRFSEGKKKIGFDFLTSWQESSPGRLGEKRKPYLCAMPSPHKEKIMMTVPFHLLWLWLVRPHHTFLHNTQFHQLKFTWKCSEKISILIKQNEPRNRFGHTLRKVERSGGRKNDNSDKTIFPLVWQMFLFQQCDNQNCWIPQI